MGASESVEVQFVEANGLRFAYLEEGEGPLVLMLHGFPDTAHTWDDLRSRVARAGYRAVSPFMRGYAPTEIPDSAPDTKTLGRDVIELVGALGAESAYLVGHDWGALAVYAACSMEPKLFEHAITVDVPHPMAQKPSLAFLWKYRHFFVFNFPGAGKRLRRGNFAYVSTLLKRWSPSWNFTEEDLDEIRRSLGEPGSAEAAVSYYEILKSGKPDPIFRTKIEVPSTAVPCLGEGAAPPSWYEAAARGYAAPYEVAGIPGGHFVHRESPDEFAALVLSKLS